MANRNQIRVSPGESGWRVHKPGSQRDIKVFSTQKEAVKRATQVAKNQKGELKIQKKDGTIQGGNSYGGDPFPPRG